ncbi:MAG: hypothetical protein KF703_12555 [Actinobacteria bacterium]|nr:hypothetical protein [Actinomycetota bacterium]
MALYAWCVAAVLWRAGSLDHPAAAVLALVTGGAALVPTLGALGRRDQAALVDPVVLAGWLFWLPIFGLGGVALALGWNRPYYLDLLADPSEALAAAQLWGLVGFLSLAAGASLPAVRRAGRGLGRLLPRPRWSPGRVRLPGALLVLGGLGVSAVALATDRLGYDATTRQQVSPVAAYLQVIALVGVALVWWDLLHAPSPRGRATVVLTLAGLAVAAIVGGSLAESRATLATWVLVVLLVTLLSGVPVPRRLAGAVAVAAVVTLVVGALVGSQYREERREGVGPAGEAIPAPGRLDALEEALDRIGARGLGNVAYLRDRSVQRLEAPGGLAVIVARNQELDGRDTADGAPRVVDSMVGSFVPRALWSDKPASTDPGAISRLYFEYEANAFATTPMGDVLRDLGPLAVPLLMALMGAVLRLVHGALVGTPPPAATGVAAFAVLAVRAPMWWEGFYATYLADLLRAGLVIAASLVFVHVAVRLQDRRSAA